MSPSDQQADLPDGSGRDRSELRRQALGGFIRDQRQVTRLSLRQLSELAGVSNPYLSQIERGMRRPSAEVLRQIARALQIPCEDLFVRAGILEERVEEPDEGRSSDVVVALRQDPHLTAEQQRSLLRLYWWFREENRADVRPEP